MSTHLDPNSDAEILSRFVRTAVASRFGFTDKPAVQTLELRSEEWKLVPTWLACQRMEGAKIDVGFLCELNDASQRVKVLHEAAQDIHARWPESRALKGPTLARLYGPIIRYCSDLDLLAGSLADVFDIAGWLTGRGWSCVDVTVYQKAREMHGLVVLVQTVNGPQSLRPALRIELTTEAVPEAVAVNGLTELHETPIDDLGLALVCIVAERSGRPFGIRDCADAWLALRTLSAQELGAVDLWLDRLDLLGFRAELARRIVQLVPACVDSLVEDRLRVWSRRSGLLRSLPRRARGFSAIRAFQMEVLRHRGSRFWESLSDHTVGRLSVRSALAQGLLLWGVPIATGAARPLRSGFALDGSTLRSPVGIWHLTPSTKVDEDVIQQAASRSGMG